MSTKVSGTPGHMISVTALVFLCPWAFVGCGSTRTKADPVIEFTRVPEAGPGNPDRFGTIAGRVTGTGPADSIVLYALSSVWWVQPFVERPFTFVQSDSSWSSSIHPGTVYAALLVDSRYRPPRTLDTLPRKGGSILAVATVKGTPPAAQPTVLRFSGYQWEVRQTSAGDVGSGSFYDARNTWLDERGFLHLRISGVRGRWANAGIRLSRSLGYGSYRIVAEDVSHLEPAAVFSIFTWDDQGATNEMDVQISRWGQPEDSNAQFLVQPWDVPANTVRFMAPPGTLDYWIRWKPGRVEFQTTRGLSSKVAGHVFTSGVPTAGNERLGITLYVYDHSPRPLQNKVEMVLETFEFLP
jgi:hypothetical protein